MSTAHLELLNEIEQRFRHIAWGCVLFYALIALALNTIKVEKPEREDFTQLSPRIASLLIKPPPPPPPQDTVKPVEEAGRPRSACAGRPNRPRVRS